MNTNIKLWAVLTAGFLVISGCGDNTTTPSTHDHADSTGTEHHSPDSMSHEPTKDTAMAGGHGLMTAMNTMMDKMSSVQMTGDFDIDFANMMIEHHKGAVEMANIELSKGTDAKMKSIAQNIISQQTDEITMLQKAIANHKSSGMKHAEGFLQKSMADTKRKMGSMQMTNNPDKDFATMMVIHHEEAIKMAKAEVENAMNADLKKMAQKTITDQTKEIGEFKTWLTSN